MTKEQIEGNKLIAEFCGWTIEPGMEDHADPYYNQPQKDGYIPAMVLASNLRYHSSWDWLMPVVGKIQEFGYSVLINCEGKKLASFTNTIVNDSQVSPTVIVDGYSEKSQIKSVYEAVVEFIKWHNKNNC